MEKLTPEQQHIIENDEHHILDMKIHIAKKQRMVNGAATLGWIGLSFIAIAWDMRWFAFIGLPIAFAYAFRCNVAWKNLDDLKEVHNERYTK